MVSNRCSICEAVVFGESHKTYFCSKCYNTWKEAITNKEEWTRFLVNEELLRRRMESRKIKNNVVLIHLGNDWDITTDGDLVRKDNFSDFNYG